MAVHLQGELRLLATHPVPRNSTDSVQLNRKNAVVDYNLNGTNIHKRHTVTYVYVDRFAHYVGMRSDTRHSSAFKPV